MFSEAEAKLQHQTCAAFQLLTVVVLPEGDLDAEGEVLPYSPASGPVKKPGT